MILHEPTQTHHNCSMSIDHLRVHSWCCTFSGNRTNIYQSWVFFGRTDAEAETPILWPPHVKGWLIGKDIDAGRNWGQEETWMTENEMAEWHDWLSAHEFGWTPGVGDGQGGLVCCHSWGHKESNSSEWLNWTELIMTYIHHYGTIQTIVSKNHILQWKGCVLLRWWF